MTGLDRLRELADDMAVQGLWGAILDGKEERWNVRYGDGMTVNGLLRAIADQIEADQEERVTRRAEDREAAEWVREHGGLEHLKSSLSAFEMLAEGIEIDTWLVFHDESPKERCVALRNEVKSRPMPEGMEWPRYEDGEPVRIGDEISWRDEGGKVNSVELQDGGYFVLHAADGAEDWIHPQYFPGERVKRPAPKVLDADGAEICVGDTVWPKYPSADRSEQVERAEVVGIQAEYGRVDVRAVYETGMSFREQVEADRLTHRAPVLAADGKPLREGETVYRLDGGGTVEIDTVFDADCIVCLKPDTGDELGHFEASELTHERPVLDADGAPIHEGDTVYFTDGREQECNTVVHAKYNYKDEPYVQLGRLNDVGYPTYTNCSCIDPSQLTHTKPEPPDSWELLEEDAAGIERDCGGTWHKPDGSSVNVVDLVRRAKALAERGV